MIKIDDKKLLGEVKEVSTEEVKINPLNKKLFRQEGAEYFNGLLESMRNQGQLVPIILRADGVLIAGENRLNVAKVLGWKTIQAQVVQKTLSEEEEMRVILDEQLKRRHLLKADRLRIYEKFFPNLQNRLLETRGGLAQFKSNTKGEQSYAVDAREIAKRTGINSHVVAKDLKTARDSQKQGKALSSRNFDMSFVRRTKLRCTMILKSLEKQKPATILRSLEHVNELRKNLKSLALTRSLIKPKRMMKVAA